MAQGQAYIKNASVHMCTRTQTKKPVFVHRQLYVASSKVKMLVSCQSIQ